MANSHFGSTTFGVDIITTSNFYKHLTSIEVNGAAFPIPKGLYVYKLYSTEDKYDREVVE